MNPEPFASIAVLCTDDRQRAAADALCRRGYVVERLIPGESDPQLLAQTDFLLLPVLVEPALLPLLTQCRRGTVLLCGRVTDELHQLAKRRSLLLHSYLQQEEMALLNAVPTAEAAIELALSQLPITLWESRCLLTGFGRCAKPLARLLTAFGTQLTVCTRQPKGPGVGAQLWADRPSSCADGHPAAAAAAHLQHRPCAHPGKGTAPAAFR